MLRDFLSRRACPVRLALVTLLLLPIASGCGATCAELAKRHADSLRPTKSASPTGWHLALALPWEVVNKKLAAYTPRDLPLALPLGQGPGKAPPLRLRLQALALKPAATDQLAVEAKLTVLAGDERAFDLALSADLAPTLEHEKRTVTLGLKPLALHQAKVTLAPDAATALASAIYRQLPDGAKRVVSPQLARVMARGIVEQLSSRLARLLAEHYGERLGSAARLQLRLPHLPLRQLGLRSLPGPQGGLVVLAQADLPLAGVSDPSKLLSPAEIAQAGARGNLLMALQPQAAVGLLNRRATGRLPRRLNYAGKPDPAGELQLTFGWQADDHPLKITVWKLGESRCAAVTFGLQPQLSCQKNKLVLKLNDRRLEQTRGRPLALATLWWQSLGEQASKRQQKMAQGIVLSLGRAEQHLRPVAASLTSERLLLELQPLAPPPPAPAATPPVS